MEAGTLEQLKKEVQADLLQKQEEDRKRASSNELEQLKKQIRAELLKEQEEKGLDRKRSSKVVESIQAEIAGIESGKPVFAYRCNVKERLALLKEELKKYLV